MKINNEAIHTTVLPGGIILVANTMTGGYLKTNNTYFEVITKIMQSNESLERFFEENDADPDIRSNLQQLYDNLVQIEYFIEEESKAVPEVAYDQIYLAVTNRCNLQCKHCCQDSRQNEKDDLTTEEISRIIDLLCEAGPKGIIFSGGEPMVREDILVLLEYAKSKFQGQIILSTNALLINETNIDHIVNNITGLSISIDGYDEESCGRIRGKNVFKKVMSVIQLLKEKGMHNISLSSVYTKYMEGHEEQFNQLCDRLGVIPVWRNLFIEGRADLNGRSLMPSDFIEKMVKIRGVSCRHCRAGERELYIDFHGDIYPCPLLQSDEFKCGNILDRDNQGIFEKNRVGKIARRKMDQYRTWRNHNCCNCEIGLFCQTCEAEYWMFQKNKDLFEKFCSEKRKFICGAIK